MVLGRCFLHSLRLVMLIAEQIQTLSNTVRMRYGADLDTTLESFQEDEVNYLRGTTETRLYRLQLWPLLVI